MSGLTWKAMVKAAENDPSLAKRVKHYLYRAPFEFYAYKQDPDALQNLINSSDHQDTVAAYREQLRKLMKKTKDHEMLNFEKAVAAQKK